jgi:hypothetical protein
MVVIVFTFLVDLLFMDFRYIPRYNLNWLLEPTWSLISKLQCSLISFDKKSVVYKKGGLKRFDPSP